ncbi:MAG: nickel-dependent hydrogenase large subunit [Promethearchaeota archaeon]
MNIDLCTRIEGHAELEYIIEKSKLTAVNFRMQYHRGFETILARKLPHDIPRIASRICGLCPASQAISSCLAVEQLLGIQETPQSNIIRRRILAADIMKSHGMHFVFQTFPDLHELTEGEPLPLEKLILEKNDLVTAIFTIIQAGKRIQECFGGRTVHPVNVVPGGVLSIPDAGERKTCKSLLNRARDAAIFAMENTIEYLKKIKPPPFLELPEVEFITSTYFPEKRGNLLVKRSRGTSRSREIEDYRELYWKEAGMDEYETSIEVPVLTGPFARFKLGRFSREDDDTKNSLDFLEKNWGNNLLAVNCLACIEMLEAINGCMDIIDGKKFQEPVARVEKTKILHDSGIGIVDAPRGTLIHDYRASKQTGIDDVSILIPTRLNIPLLNELLTRNSVKLHESGKHTDSIKHQAQMIVHIFDPCVACATHAIKVKS